MAPGFIETDMTNEHLKAERGDAIRAQSPFNRVARPEEVAAAVLRSSPVDGDSHRPITRPIPERQLPTLGKAREP